MGRAVVVGIPVWIAMLALLPQTGLGPMACLGLATIVAAAAIVTAFRSRRRLAPAPDGARTARRPMGALAGAGVALGAVALLAYAIFVLRA